jgi:hypothetical protein
MKSNILPLNGTFIVSTYWKGLSPAALFIPTPLWWIFEFRKQTTALLRSPFRGFILHWSYQINQRLGCSRNATETSKISPP